MHVCMVAVSGRLNDVLAPVLAPASDGSFPALMAADRISSGVSFIGRGCEGTVGADVMVFVLCVLLNEL